MQLLYHNLEKLNSKIVGQHLQLLQMDFINGKIFELQN